MNWVQINIQVNEDFRYMKIHIFALRWKDEGPEIFFRSYLQLLVSVVFLAARIS